MLGFNKKIIFFFISSQEMAKRRTAASQERMRIISQLAKREKKEDNFGMRDEDWDVYKAINKV